MEQMTDAELVREVRNGNRRAFNLLMLRYQERVYWTARRLVGNHEDADDVAQETFVRAYMALGEFRGDASFFTTIEPYYQILVRSESDYPRGGAPISVCPVCKHEVIDDVKRELAMHEDMWRGRPIFLLRTTLYVIVTEVLAEKIRQFGATNVDFVPI